MPKFFVSEQAIQDGYISLTDDNFRHIKTVLRLHLQDKILINDGQGNDYKCIIEKIGDHEMIARIEEIQRAKVEPTTQTYLFQALIKGEKMDWVIQKAVEIGITAIIPIETNRCVVKLEKGKKAEAKRERWQKIAESAAKQSGRAIIPTVHVPTSFKEAILYAKENIESAFIPYEKEKSMSLKQFLQKPKANKYGIFIGPEGGFTEDEIFYAEREGISSVTLGKRILRSETAGLVTLSIMMYEKGEME
jgi:16S rRNA (uracil1498-N3)-methyltransferase